MFQVMPHRCARLLLVAPADRSRNRMVLAPHKKPCLATKTSGRLGLSINARRDMTQQHRHGLLEQDVLAGPCDREVEAVIVGDIAQVTFIVPIELPESGLNGLDVRPCPASGGQPCRFAFQRGPKLEAEDQGGNAGDWGKLDRSVLLPTDDKGPRAVAGCYEPVRL